MLTTKVMNHGEYRKQVKSYDYNRLLYILRDAREAIEAMPDNPNNGYYQDEIHYCAMELNDRLNKERGSKNVYR